ncbi:MAG: pentapeptide repeat-containing protein [Rhizobiales bacterium]|nr:pentapeptide repeat-containing protein [Hyphomicrobiales bacterium]
MKRVLVGGAAFWLACVAALSSATAGCKDVAAPAVEWQGCNKQMLQLENSDLAGANLEGAFLSGSAFHEANLAGANLRRSELLRTSFIGANLSGADFEKALASRALFEKSQLKGARLTKAEFQRVSFDESDLTGVDMEEGDFVRNSFRKSNLSGVNFTGALMPRSVFHESNLKGANFTRTYLYWARFEGVDLSEVTGLTQMQLDMTCGDDKTKLPAGLTVPARWPCGED